jgi:hypothetical protein
VWFCGFVGQLALHCVMLVEPPPPVEFEGLQILADSSQVYVVSHLHCCVHHSSFGMPCAVFAHVGPLAPHLHSYCQSHPKVFLPSPALHCAAVENWHFLPVGSVHLLHAGSLVVSVGMSHWYSCEHLLSHSLSPWQPTSPFAHFTHLAWTGSHLKVDSSMQESEQVWWSEHPLSPPVQTSHVYLSVLHFHWASWVQPSMQACRSTVPSPGLPESSHL